MKMRKWLVMPVVAVGLGACQKKESAPANPEVPGETAQTSPGTAPSAQATPAAPAVGAEQRAAKLGFAKHLPKDTDSVITVFNGVKTVERAKALKLWKLIEEESGVAGEPLEEGIGAAPDAAAPAAPVPGQEPTVPGEVPATPPVAGGLAGEEKPFGPETLLENEVTIAFGKPAGEQAAHLMTLNRRSTYFQFRGLAATLVAAAKSGDPAAFEQSAALTMGPQLLLDVLKDEESGVGLIEKLQLPPIYVAFRPEASKREAAVQEIASNLGILSLGGEMVEPLEFEKNGSKFTGYKIVGTKISEALAAQKDAMAQTLGPELADRLIAAAGKNDIIITVGTFGDYVVLFLGTKPEDFALVPDAKDSLLGGSSVAFGDAYLSKDLSALVYAEDKSMKGILASAGGLSDIINGLRDGLAGDAGLGDIREIESLLQIVAEREQDLRKLATTGATGIVAFFEQGLKVESFGGTDQGALDWKTPVKLAHLGDAPGTVLFATAGADAVYDEKARELMEAIGESAYAITLKVSELPVENPEMTQFKEMAKLFDEKFRVDVVAFWDALSGDVSRGLGHESALVVDFNGTFPAFPGVPQEVVDQAKFPRISVVSPVADRAKLGEAWDKMNLAGTSVLAKISEMAGQDIPMQKPISSERNGNLTWFFPMPFFNDDFMPSVTVGDEWFATSTSKTQALDLIAKAAEKKEAPAGLRFKVDFAALQKYAGDLFKVVDKNAVAILGEGSEQFDQFTENREDILKAIGTLDDFDAIDAYYRKEGSVVRGSVHFKTR